MFVEGGWKPAGEPPRKPRLSKGEELTLLWVLGVFAVLMLIAPLGGATLIEAAIAVFARTP